MFCNQTSFDCVDPTADNELYECNATPPAALPCPTDVIQTWKIENSEQARALAAAVNCSGGSFEVEWSGHVVVDETIYVVNGTVLSVKGAGTGAVVDGNKSTRPFTVVDATLRLSDVNITAGASVAGAAVAAAGSVLSFNRTSFVGNSATGDGGAVFVSDGSNVSCTGGGEFADNAADMNGGAMFVTGSSTVSCGMSWFQNTAGRGGGAIFVEDNSRVWWRDEATFAFNTATSGGALYGMSSSISWSGPTHFFSNTGLYGGGGLSVDDSMVSWSGATSFSNCASTIGPGGAMEAQKSAISWSGNAEFIANTAEAGGAIYVKNGTSISWTGTTEFMSNAAGTWGGAVGSDAQDSLTNIADSVLVMNGSTAFSNNSCGANGGALALYATLSVDVGEVDISFTNNTAALSGGAVFISDAGTGPTFLSVRFVSNSAQIGGAVSSVASGNLLESGSVKPTTFDRCRFVGNRAAATGGAVESAAGQDAFVGSVFEGNKAGTGGALRLAGTSSMENCSFVENMSDDGGGAAVSNIGSIEEMVNISFSGNVFDCKPGMFLNYSAVSDDVCACSQLGDPPLLCG